MLHRVLPCRQREEDDREEKKRKEENAKRKQMRNERKEFLDTRTQRINAWREYKDSVRRLHHSACMCLSMCPCIAPAPT